MDLTRGGGGEQSPADEAALGAVVADVAANEAVGAVGVEARPHAADDTAWTSARNVNQDRRTARRRTRGHTTSDSRDVVLHGRRLRGRSRGTLPRRIL